MDKSSGKPCQGKKFLTGRTYVFNENIANEYGLEAAVIIQHFQYSIGHHKKKGTHFYEGRYWAYDSLDNLVDLYPFFSKSKVRRIIDRLLEDKVLIPGNFNKNPYDHTRWFSFQNEDDFIQN